MDETIINLTENAIESLGDVNLILIDNGSTFGAGALKGWADVYIKNKQNLGYAKAVNQGLDYLREEELVTIANNDIRVSLNWWDVAQEIFNNKEVGSLHYRMLSYDEPFELGNDTWIGGKERWCTSSFFTVRNVQRYDENYMNSIEDWDFWMRMRKKYRQAYTNKAQYQHMDSFTRWKLPEIEEQDKKNREYFVEKWGEEPEALFDKEFPGEREKPWKPLP